MVTVLAPVERSVWVVAYPLPWNTISTLGAATHAQYNYDYAGQDPINNYDLSGTVAAAQVSDPANPTCAVTGCGAGTNFARDHTSLLRIALVGAASVGVVVTGVLADDFVAAALADASEQGAGLRQLVHDLFHGDRDVRSEALKHLRIRLSHAGNAAVHTLHRSGGSAASAARAWIQTLWRGW